MPAFVLILVQILGTVGPLLKELPGIVAAIRDAIDTVQDALAENRDLTPEEYTRLNAAHAAAGDELQRLASEAAKEVIT